MAKKILKKTAVKNTVNKVIPKPLKKTTGREPAIKPIVKAPVTNTNKVKLSPKKTDVKAPEVKNKLSAKPIKKPLVITTSKEKPLLKKAVVKKEEVKKDPAKKAPIATTSKKKSLPKKAVAEVPEAENDLSEIIITEQAIITNINSEDTVPGEMIVVETEISNDDDLPAINTYKTPLDKWFEFVTFPFRLWYK